MRDLEAFALVIDFGMIAEYEQLEPTQKVYREV
jgi:hypothetical protein